MTHSETIRPRIVWFLRLAVLMWIAVPAIVAQVSTGTITGNVRDASGAVVLGAKVTILETRTGERRETMSNERGDFTASYLRIGTYSVTVAATGFKSEVNTGLVLQVDKVITLSFSLQPGAVTESVEVAATAPLVDASTSSLGQVI